MTFNLEFRINTGRLKFAPVLGRRTFYANVGIGPFSLWLERWDTGRTKRPLVFSRDRLMAWSAGIRTPATLAKLAKPVTSVMSKAELHA